MKKHLSLHWYFLALVALCSLAMLFSTWFAILSYESVLSAEVARLSDPTTVLNSKQAAQRTEVLASIGAELEFAAKRVWQRCVAVTVLLIGLITIASLVLYRGLVRPLGEMSKRAEGLAVAEFERRLPVYRLEEINTLARAMDRMALQLKHLEEVRSDFVANVSHELKTPITSIQGFVETLLEGALEDPADLQRFLEIINKQSERLSEIIDDLLMLARLESGQIEDKLILQEEYVRPLLDAVAHSVDSPLQPEEIDLRIECAGDLQAKFDRSLMEQAVGNLFHNAIKYSGSDKPIVLSASRDAQWVYIKVKDQGPGISPEHQPRLFERFYRVDKARSRAVGGTGLGLSIVKHIVGVHGGAVAVESKPGTGSEFIIKLPTS